MEQTPSPPTVVEQYREKFGDAGYFDTALFPELATLGLMAEAVRRGTPVTQADLEAMHETLYHLPMPTPETAQWPSGAPGAVPSATTTTLPPEFYIAPQAVPVVEEPAPAPVETPAPVEAAPAPVEEEAQRSRRERRGSESAEGEPA
jgi:hypothetical protein